MKSIQEEMKHDKRIFEYLIGHYKRLSQKAQKEHLEKIIARLCDGEILNETLARDIAEALIETEAYTMPMLLAHFDMLDLEERT